MPASRCPTCLVNYPAGVQHCAHCDEPTNPVPTESPDTPAEIKLKHTTYEGLKRNDPVYWRFEELLRLGLDLDTAQRAAHDKNIDLRKFETLAAKAGPSLAYDILRS